MRAFGFVLVVLGLALAAAPAHAAADYRADSDDWNGLARLVAEADALGCPVRAADTLDWSALGPHDVLWLIYPSTPVDGERLRRFLAGGGRAVVADDFGAAASALAALGLRRARLPLDHTPRYQDNPALPIAELTLVTELGQGTASSSLVANHPSVFTGMTAATYQFQPGAALVVEGRLGTGYFVALSDPSVLINNMLEIPDNLGFARALVRRTCKAGEDRVLLLSGALVERGEPPADLGRVRDASALAARFNRMIGGMNESVRAVAGDRSLLMALGLGLSVGALVLLWRGLPRRTAIDGRWTRARSSGFDAPPRSRQGRGTR